VLAFALLLLALGPPVILFDGDLAVPRSRARGIPVKINRPTYVHSKFDTKEPQAQVRAALLTAADVRAYQDGRPHEILAGTEYAAFGEFRFLVMRPGDYFVLIDNRMDTRSSLEVHAVVTASEDPSLPRTLPAARRYTIAAISLILFGAVAGWSGLRIRRAWPFR
jgi:hypothetical protein